MHPSAILAQQLAAELGAVIFPVRRDKTPVLTGWRKLTRAQTDSPKFRRRFSDASPSLGVLLGPTSNHLCSVDLDSDEWLERFLAANPALTGTLISRGARGGNVWVRLRGDYPPLGRLVRGKEAVGEWRATGGYTIIAGLHPSGCKYRRTGGPPVELAFEDIHWPAGVQLKRLKGGRTPQPPPHSSAALPECTSAPLPVCTSAPLHNMDDESQGEGDRPTSLAPALAPQAAPPRVTAAQLLEHQQAESSARARLERKSPGLAQLYAQMLDRHYEARPHERNAVIVEAVPFLYRAVARQFVVPLVCHFYERHAPLYRDSLAQHRQQAEAMLAGVRETYLASLPADEAALYRSLPEDQRDTYRICRDLAARSEPPAERATFFLSSDQLALRLDVRSMEAHRLLDKLRKLAVLEVAVPGTKRAAGKPGRATTYRWLLPLA
ncbi:MAG: bifunctional DNA primase/polymerase [Verrucomicrobiae bacterium]|nr:bifunctional DNA primase/polymerase [Verrucomicrobiae bacterium]